MRAEPGAVEHRRFLVRVGAAQVNRIAAWSAGNAEHRISARVDREAGLLLRAAASVIRLGLGAGQRREIDIGRGDRTLPVDREVEHPFD
jgi:hypothetical protein